MRFRRQRVLVAPSVDPFVALAARAVTDGQRRQYAQGVADGLEIALKAVIGDPIPGGDPYDGPIPDELRSFCQGALARIADDRVQTTIRNGD